MRKDLVAIGIARCFVVMSGGFAVICCILGLVYLWPTVDPFGLHPHSYLERILWAIVGIFVALIVAAWTALVRHELRRRRRAAAGADA